MTYIVRMAILEFADGHAGHGSSYQCQNLLIHKELCSSILGAGLLRISSLTHTQNNKITLATYYLFKSKQCTSKGL